MRIAVLETRIHSQSQTNQVLKKLNTLLLFITLMDVDYEEERNTTAFTVVVVLTL